MHRAFHAIDAPLTAPDGRPTNALFGFFAMFGNIVSKLRPDGVIVAFDEGKPMFRLEVLAQYKMHRPPTDERLRAQFGTVRDLLDVLKVPVVMLPHWEGDDILGTLARLAYEKGMRTYLATSDKDAYQLINDMTYAVTTKAGQRSEVIVTTPHDVLERYGIRTDQVTDYLGLKGDPSDNIPGIPGIGEKTAARLLQEYETLEAAIEAAKEGRVPGHIGKKLVEGEDAAYASRVVATIVCDVPIDLDVEQVEFGMFDRDEVVAAFTTLRVRAPLTKLLTLQRDGVASPSVEPPEEAHPVSSLAPSAQPPVDVARLLEGIDFNHEIAAYLLDSSQSRYDIETLAEQYLGIEIPAQTSLLEPAVDSEKIKADLTPVLATKLVENDMWELYTCIELPLRAVLARMEKAGVALDTDLLADLAREGRSRIDELTGEIYHLAGHEFVIDSPKQLSVILFEELGLTPSKKTKTGYSTNATVLEGLVDAHPIIEKVMLYREYVKLQSTYLETLPHLLGSDGRLHTHFNQTVAATGRLSSSNPNLQNIPVRTEVGRRIREAFVPSHPGWKMVSADYSQIELRVLAHLSGDGGLIDAFESGEDFHAATAARIFGVDPAEVTTELRVRAKAVNFGIVYGQSAHGLSQSLGISNREAQEMIDRYYAAYSRVHAYLQELVQQAQTHGWVATAFGRRRYTPEIQSRAHNIREFGKRTAMNHPMQGTAADLIKLAMIAIDEKLCEEDLQTRMLLQVHDELIFDCPNEELEHIKLLVTDVMTHVASFKVALEVSISTGDNWAQAK
jgi:DNA polymerase-1